MDYQTNQYQEDQVGELDEFYHEPITPSIVKDRSILQELDGYDLPEEIKQHADQIFKSMKKIVYRSKVRKQLLFYCVYCAYSELHYAINIVLLGKMFKLTSGEIQRCDSLFSPSITGYKLRTNLTPLSYIPEYCNNLGLDNETIESIKDFSLGIMRKSKKLQQVNMQSAAAALIKYYLLINGINISAKEMTEATGRSMVTIEGISSIISSIDNS